MQKYFTFYEKKNQSIILTFIDNEASQPIFRSLVKTLMLLKTKL